MSKNKYVLTETTKVVNGVKVYQIKANRTFLSRGGRVEENDLGGYIQHKNNLLQIGEAWVTKDAVVYGDARIEDNALVTDNARVYDQAVIAGNAYICDSAIVHDYAFIHDDAIVGQNADVGGAANIYEKVCILRNAKITGTTVVGGGIPIFTDLTRSPIVIQGSRHTLRYCGGQQLQIGCNRMSFDEWYWRYKKEGAENLYTKEQIKEYYQHIKYIVAYVRKYGD